MIPFTVFESWLRLLSYLVFLECVSQEMVILGLYINNTQMMVIHDGFPRHALQVIAQFTTVNTEGRESEKKRFSKVIQCVPDGKSGMDIGENQGQNQEKKG